MVTTEEHDKCVLELRKKEQRNKRRRERNAEARREELIQVQHHDRSSHVAGAEKKLLRNRQRREVNAKKKELREQEYARLEGVGLLQNKRSKRLVQLASSRGLVVDCSVEGSIDKGNDIVGQRIHLHGEHFTSTENEFPARCEGVLHDQGSTSGSCKFIDIQSDTMASKKSKRKTTMGISYIIHAIPTISFTLRLPSTCTFCRAKKFQRESKGFCCSFGKIRLHSPEVPEQLHTLFTSKSKESNEFKTYVRTYNSNFAFTSFGVKCDQDLCKRNKGIYTFRVQGQISHYINDILPSNSRPCYLQLYFYDTENELKNRLNISDRLSETILKKLIDILDINPYSRFFRSLNSVPDLETCTLRIRSIPGHDQRVYNAPLASQVAALWVEEDPSSSTRMRDILVHCHSGSTHKVHYYFGCYDSLQYPLLFPRGETGWHEGIERPSGQQVDNDLFVDNLLDINHISSVQELIENETIVMKKKKRLQVSCREYYCYKLQVRSSDNSILLHSGRLLQQYVVDMYVKIETSRLDYFRNNQIEIRAELYQGIIDSLHVGQNRGDQIGRRIVLPSSFTGGPRDMQKRYIDAMALVQKFGKPDIFLTITCNPNWPEIKEELRYNDETQNRPDLLARIFRAKLEELKDDLFKKEIFGPVAAYIYVVEFQKRGLPHAHFLLILRRDSKLVSIDLIDQIVCAEIPDEDQNPYLHSAVLKHMMHGPCGTLNPNNVCMQPNGVCRSKYPKEYISETTYGNDSYPRYRRCLDNRRVKIRGQFLDNRWVVPYSSYLLAKFDCHMNVEICSTVKAVKYLYKYVYKGHDRIAFSVDTDKDNEVVDEIRKFQSARWISPPEAVWRIFGFTLFEMRPSVISLQLHLPNSQLVTYRNYDNLQRVVGRDYAQKTMLTEYFNLNLVSDVAKRILYREFPQYFVWDARDKCWTDRKKGHVIGRIVSANPLEGERYYLRILLNHIRGATSFENLKVVNGVPVISFREAALLHGLLREDNSCELCLQEASVYQMPSSLRRLFATILAYCTPNDPVNLWNKFKLDLYEDYMHSGMSLKEAELKTLQSINTLLEQIGKSINDYKLVSYDVNLREDEMFTQIIGEQLQIRTCEQDLASACTLNEDQRFAYDTILERIYSGVGGMFFVDGPGGTGKTYLYRAMLASLRSKNIICLATASSGVAAALLPGGRTAHSMFKIPLNVGCDIVCSVSKQSALADLFRITKLIIWDEAPMVNRCAVEALDKMLQDITDCSLYFGGKVVVLGGDFCQVLPVVPKGKQEDIIHASLPYSYLWPHFSKIQLIQNMRARLDPLFSEFLLRIGNGTETIHSCDMIRLLPEITISFQNEVASLKQLIHIVFPHLDNYVDNLDFMINRVILTPKNECVDQINNILLEEFPGDNFTYYSFDESIDDTEHTLQEEFLNTLTLNGIPPHELILKRNCPVILLRNINPSEGLCNGTRLICRAFERNVIDAEIAVGEYRGKRVFLPRIPFIPLAGDHNPLAFKRTQFPIRPCFAMTINKSQGQTLNFVGLYIPEPVFSHGQLYVALSRAQTSQSIKVLIKPIVHGESHERCTKNVVYRELLALVDSS